MTFFELELNSKQQQQIQGEKAQLRQVPGELPNGIDEIRLCGLAQQERGKKRLQTERVQSCYS